MKTTDIIDRLAYIEDMTARDARLAQSEAMDIYWALEDELASPWYLCAGNPLDIEAACLLANELADRAGDIADAALQVRFAQLDRAGVLRSCLPEPTCTCQPDRCCDLCLPF